MIRTLGKYRNESDATSDREHAREVFRLVWDYRNGRVESTNTVASEDAWRAHLKNNFVYAHEVTTFMKHPEFIADLKSAMAEREARTMEYMAQFAPSVPYVRT